MIKCIDCIGKDDCKLTGPDYDSCLAGASYRDKSGLDGVLEDVMFDAIEVAN
jgi:hypothetical protein